MPVRGQAEGRGRLTKRLSWRRWWIRYRANGCGLHRAKPRSPVSQWQLLPSAGKGGGLHLQLLLSCRKGVSPGTQICWLALQQTTCLRAGMSSQCRARLSGRITASGICEMPNSLTPGDTQTDGCEKLCLKTERSRQRCCLLGCHIHLSDKTDGKSTPGITYRV